MIGGYGRERCQDRCSDDKEREREKEKKKSKTKQGREKGWSVSGKAKPSVRGWWKYLRIHDSCELKIFMCKVSSTPSARRLGGRLGEGGIFSWLSFITYYCFFTFIDLIWFDCPGLTLSYYLLLTFRLSLLLASHILSFPAPWIDAD